MGHRSFTDTAGIVWNVWDVLPQWTERRSGERRRTDPDDVADPPVLERRRKGNRRADAGETPGARIRIAAGLSRGWLAFEGGGDKRRLAPIPPGWEAFDDSQLAELCRRATPIVSRPRAAE
jgi:hypothetical protein